MYICKNIKFESCNSDYITCQEENKVSGKCRFRARLIMKDKSFQSRLRWIKRNEWKKCTRNERQNDKGNEKETEHLWANVLIHASELVKSFSCVIISFFPIY